MWGKNNVKKYCDIKALCENRFLNMYHMDAMTDSGRAFDYYFVSRNDINNIKVKTGENKPEGIVIFPVLADNPNKIVLIKQYRYPIGDYLYELPAGLIDEGEAPKEAAVREMLEETGMELEIYEDGFDAVRRPFYMGAGYTDESCSLVFGYAREHGNKCTEDTESIQVVIADKNEIKRILREEKVSLRCSYLMMLFLNNDKENPFAFLDL